MKFLKLPLLFVFLALPLHLQAQADTHYVTIGVFAKLDNAVRFTDQANKAGFHAEYSINPGRNLYYVFVLQTEEKRKAFAFVIKLRAESAYKDAWVFTGKLGESQPEVKTPVVEKAPDPVIEEPVKKEPVIEPVKVDSSAFVKPAEKKKAKGKFFVFKFLNKENGSEVTGEIHFAESSKATQYQAFKANELVDIAPPRNTAGSYVISTIAPGYKPFKTTLNYKDPAPASSGNGPDGEFIIPIELERAKRGDYIEFNNVVFYRNSAILQPQSIPEMEGLVALMKENTRYKVRVHGHCNGTESRDIVTLGSSNDYFQANTGNVKKPGSAKELTELRAETVRRYLVSQGIGVERILTKGEGGKMMVYPQNSVYAAFNDRVEIEILKH
ncbi:MAG: OmpA family protein [Cyclobacteriaceae bacterium]|nr:OmpA family protein [Cyclobacteriaceae bacterium]